MCIKTFPGKTAGILISVMLLILSLPLQMIIFIVLLIELKKFPVIIQERGITLTSGRVKILKFRTFRDDKIPAAGEYGNSVFIKESRNISISGFAKYLRLSGMDELPQLFNAAAGSMNLIGPRPLIINELEHIKKYFPSHYEIRLHLNSRPGITGLWQIYCNRNFGIDNLTEYDRLYEMHKSLSLNLRIALRTLLQMITAETSDSFFNADNFQIPVNSIRYVYRKRINFHLNGRNNFIDEVSLPWDYWVSSASQYGAVIQKV